MKSKINAIFVAVMHIHFFVWSWREEMKNLFLFSHVSGRSNANGYWFCGVEDASKLAVETERRRSTSVSG